MPRCEQEMCPNWSGDGNVCPCAVFDLDRAIENQQGRMCNEHDVPMTACGCWPEN